MKTNYSSIKYLCKHLQANDYTFENIKYIHLFFDICKQINKKKKKA